MVQSQFKNKAFVSLPFIAVLTILIISILINFEDAFTGPGGGVFVLSIMSFMDMVLIYSTLKTQQITIDKDVISVKGLLGKGIRKNYQFNQISGYYTGSYEFRGNVENIIYIVRNNKKLARISDNNHKNYAELKSMLEINIKYLGAARISPVLELRGSVKPVSG